MSVVDLISGGSEGEAFEQWDYDRCNQDEIRFSSVEPSFITQQHLSQLPLHQRVAWSEHGHLKISIVDNLVQVTGFSQSYRKEGANFWRTKQIQVLAFGVGLAAVGGLGAVGAISFLPAVVGHVAATICGLSGLIFGLAGGIGAVDAQKQIMLWERDLAEVVARQRQEAFNTGLISIYVKDSVKTGKHDVPYASILSGTELGELYYNYFSELNSQMAQAYNANRCLEVLENVAEYSPLNFDILSYAQVDDEMFKLLTPYCQEHAKFEHTFALVEDMVSNRIADVKREALVQVNAIACTKQLALDEVHRTYRLYQEEAKRVRNEQLAAYPPEAEYAQGFDRGQVIDAIHRDYEAQVAQAKAIRDAGIRLTSAPYDLQISDIWRSYSAYVEEIKRNRDEQLLPLFTHVADLHQEAYSVITGAQPARVNFEHYEFRPAFPVYHSQPLYASPQRFVDVMAAERAHYDSRVFDQMLRIYSSQSAVL